MYHSDYSRWSFGKLSALTEATLALEGQYEYYYMGFYIHSCIKMRYKGDYRPQEVLDPMSYHWHPLDDFKPKLDQTKFVSLDVEVPEVDSSGSGGSIWQYKTPVEVENSEQGLLATGMPGLLSKEQLQHEINLDEVLVFLGRNKLCYTQVRHIE